MMSSEERTKTDLKREYKVENNKVVINSVVTETVPIGEFLDIFAQKLQNLEQQRNQLNGILAQMNQIEAHIPQMDEARKADLMKKKNDYTIIRNMDKFETLQTNARKLQVSIANLEKDCKETQGEVEKLSKKAQPVEEKK